MATTLELKTKFTKLLKEMFQLDQPELDFGLYKIMHSKAERINRFLDVELANQIDAVFADADQANQNQAIEAAKQTLVGQLGEGAFDENGELVEHFKIVPAAKDYLNAVAQARSGKGNLSERAMIYDHLIRFFSRYYDGGDFMSRRYHVAENKSRAAAYAVPYDGSEVYLHWANKDQYYIKTTESFNQYSFDIAEASKKQVEQGQKQNQAGTLDLEAAPQLAEKRIHFKLVDADQGEHNNNKESEKRQFFIREEQPLALNEAGELEVYFEFRVAGKSDAISAEQEKQLKSRFGASNKGDLPNLYITQVIQDTLLAMQEQPGLVDFIQFVQVFAPTDKIKQRPLLTKYLNNYTSKNTMDYFIHKDLGGFLQRELDFYIKNEIIRLDDIEQVDEVSYSRLIKQIKTLRGVAKEIIQFLAQLEDFQKKLWLKKKFVTETQYCITLDRLQNQPGLVEIALSNEAQRKEWVSLFAIDLAKLDQIKVQGIEAVLAIPKYRYLVLDTQFFESAFKDELLAETEDLEEQSNGLLINSDNYQGLSFIKNKFNSMVDCVHIDPPYNTSSSGFLYKNTYQHSSWLSLMMERLMLSTELMSDSASLACHIDENEYERLYSLVEHLGLPYLGTIIWDKKNPMMGGKGIAVQHEYIIWGSNYLGQFQANNDNVMKILEAAEKFVVMHNGVNENSKSEFASWVRSQTEFTGGEKAYYFLEDDGRVYRHVAMTWPNPNPAPEKFFIPLIHPQTNQPCPTPGRGWSRSPEKMRELLEKNEIVFGKDHTTIPQRKIYLSQYSKKPMASVIQNGTKGKLEIDKLGLNFSYCHPVSLYEDITNGALNGNGGIVLDYFAGSGTTGHSVINLNRNNQSNDISFILIEMGKYFDSVTKVRQVKAIYAKDWKDGKPIFDKQGNAYGVSQCFKYLRLEQYEDTLNNLSDSRTYQPESVPKDFVLSYLLEAETAESSSLLNLKQFAQPRNYQLQIKRPNSDQCIPHAIDLVETFNWLIGLNVVKLDKWRAYDCEFEREHDPELPNDQHTRLKVSRMKQADAYSEDAPVYQIRTVEGWVRRQPGNDELRDSVLVIWRNLSDDPEKDSAVLEALLEKLAINQADSQFDKIYINGPHGLQLHGSAKTRLLSLEDTFMTKMWEGA